MPVFADDFETGNLDNWLVGGRQLGTNVANVVPCNTGSLCGHLYHAGFTEVTLSKDFEFDTNKLFYFDLEVDVYSQSPPASNYYGAAGVNFAFLDSMENSLGSVWYVAATTDYPFTNWVSSTVSVNQIPENIMNHYAVSVSDMLSQIDIDENQVAGIRMMICEGDCDDNDPDTYLGAPELCGDDGKGDGLDNNCNGQIDEGCNQPPICSNATPSISKIWPPNHKMVNIEILDVIDFDDDHVNITITNITQNEAVNDRGDGNTYPDVDGIGTNTAKVRAERSGKGNSRIYEIFFTASDGQGGECNGSVQVCVPHDAKDGCIDDGQTYD